MRAPTSHLQSFASLVLLGSVLLAPLKAWAYGAQGHELVADVAELYLQQDAKGQAVLARIKTILPADETMAQASTWADRIKGGAGFPPPPADAAPFLALVAAKFGKPGAASPWHYVDVPFQEEHYSRLDPWTRPDDVVQMIRICVQTLHDGAPPADAPVAFTQLDALRLLIHYVGDEHQPLHVGCGYTVKGGTQFVMPSTFDLMTGRVADDQGGNALTVLVNGKPLLDEKGKPVKFHTYWDSNTVRNALKDQAVPAFAQTLMAITPQPNWNASGDMKYWAKQWADDGVHQAAIAYQGVSIVAVNDRGADIMLPPNYDQTSASLVQTQIAKGGYRLARLLEAALGTP